ncbi:MAG: hypothetical protein KF915_18305 [Polyangiaceae bacterium]|nr:hypothetical protein [Polyangiaceae bacterium]
MNYSSHLAYVPSLKLSIVVLSNRGPTISQMDAIASGLVASSVTDARPSLPPLDDEAFAYDVFFAAIPLIIYALIGGLFLQMARGPRKSLASWLTSLVGLVSALIVLNSILDFYGDRRSLALMGASLPALAVLIQRRRCRAHLSEAPLDRREKRRVFIGLVTIAALVYATRGDNRLLVLASVALTLAPASWLLRQGQLTSFARFEYPNAIGPGVYDIHSPRVPTEEEITLLLTKAIEVLPTAKLWVNPDCGLKTRGWPEVDAALRAMVSAAHVARQGAAGG